MVCFVQELAQRSFDAVLSSTHGEVDLIMPFAKFRDIVSAEQNVGSPSVPAPDVKRCDMDARIVLQQLVQDNLAIAFQCNADALVSYGWYRFQNAFVNHIRLCLASISNFQTTRLVPYHRFQRRIRTSQTSLIPYSTFMNTYLYSMKSGKRRFLTSLSRSSGTDVIITGNLQKSSRHFVSRGRRWRSFT